MSHYKLFQTMKRKDHASSYKTQPSSIGLSSVDEAILFGGYMELADLRVRMADHSHRVHRKLASICLCGLDRF